LNASELSCTSVADLHKAEYYGTLGYSIKAINDIDISPSMTFLIANSPTKVITKVPKSL
jgi:hypothetical protein